MSDDPALILFDYGGVLLRLNEPVGHFGLGTDHADFLDRWLHAPAVQAYETGRIGTEEFGRRMVADLALPYSPDEFIQRFDAWPDRVAPATAALVQSIPAHIDCAILSNTNALHWANQDIPGDFGGRIGRCFLSFELGRMKPDPAVFRHVVEATGHGPGDILFIDDTARNIDVARHEGFRARHCRDVEALAGVLRAEGLAD